MIPKDYDEILRTEVKRIIRKYPERLKNAFSILSETQKIMREEGTIDPEFNRLVPLEVLATIKKAGGVYKILKELEDEENLMSKYSKDSMGSAGSRYDIEEKNKEKNKENKKPSEPGFLK